MLAWACKCSLEWPFIWVGKSSTGSLTLSHQNPIFNPWSPKTCSNNCLQVQHTTMHNKNTKQPHNSQHLTIFHNFLTLAQGHHFQFNLRNHIHIINWKLASPLPEFRWTKTLQQLTLPLALLPCSWFSPLSLKTLVFLYVKMFYALPFPILTNISLTPFSFHLTPLNSHN